MISLPLPIKLVAIIMATIVLFATLATTAPQGRQPRDTPVGTSNGSDSTSLSRTTTSTGSSSSSDEAPTTKQPEDQESSSTPTQLVTTTTTEANTELPDFTSTQNTSTFSCQGKVTGYYADVKLGCRVYHFCTQIDGIDGTSYQRMSYICLEGSMFDQKDLNCVRRADLKVQCEDAEREYDTSNRQFDPKEESQPSMSDSLAANIMMNPITRFIAGR